MICKTNEVLVCRFLPTRLSELQILHRLYCPSEVVQLSVQSSGNFLFCGHNEGLHAWDITSLDSLKQDR